MTYIPNELRRLVFERAHYRCEYCLIHRNDHVLPFEIDHIIAEKHGGLTTGDNLCASCWDCNHYKGSDIAGADPTTGQATFIYRPRTQLWDEHFTSQAGVIIPKTPEGRVTIFLLQLNRSERVVEREMLSKLKRWP